MLVDVKVAAPDGPTGEVLAIIGRGVRGGIHHGTGLYEIGHWNFELVAAAKLERYPDLAGVRDTLVDGFTEPMDGCGVCDSPDQFMAWCGPQLSADPRHFVVAFCAIRKVEQGDGGWRWHKWGPYIGHQQRSGCEFLADEPEIEAVYTYHVYEVLPRDELRVAADVLQERGLRVDQQELARLLGVATSAPPQCPHAANQPRSSCPACGEQDRKEGR